MVGTPTYTITHTRVQWSNALAIGISITWGANTEVMAYRIRHVQPHLNTAVEYPHWWLGLPQNETLEIERPELNNANIWCTEIEVIGRNNTEGEDSDVIHIEYTWPVWET